MVVRHEDGFYVLGPGDDVRIAGGDGLWRLVVVTAGGREVVLARAMAREVIQAAYERLLAAAGNYWPVVSLRQYTDLREVE